MVYNTQHGFVKFKDINDFKEMSFDFMHKKLNEFHKKFEGRKNLTPKTKKNENLKTKVLDGSGDLFNELHYIYGDKNEEKKDDIKKFDYKKI